MGVMDYSADDWQATMRMNKSIGTGLQPLTEDGRRRSEPSLATRWHHHEQGLATSGLRRNSVQKDSLYRPVRVPKLLHFLPTVCTGEVRSIAPLKPPVYPSSGSDRWRYLEEVANP